jgi:adenine-specific DNA methylase
MLRADTLFIDPPWNTGNLRSFYTKADMEWPEEDFNALMKALFERIDQIAPKFLFLEMGKQALKKCVDLCYARYKYVSYYNATYYKRSNNICYVIHATNDATRARYEALDAQDEESIISWICANHQYECIGDLCMGTGLVGKHAYLTGKPFVGTELNKKRLAMLVDFIAGAEQKVKR